MGAIFFPDGDFTSLFIPHILQEIYYDRIYDNVFKDREPHSMTILDVGANIGLVTQFMQPYAKKLYAIEPAKEAFACLSSMKHYHRWQNVEIFKMAIANTEGVASISKNPFNSTSNSMVFGYGGETEQVEAVSLSRFFQDHDINLVDFLKLDVEGAEQFILQGEGFLSVADKIKAMEVEFHFMDWPDMVEKMEKLGFHSQRKDCKAIVVQFTKL